MCHSVSFLPALGNCRQNTREKVLAKFSKQKEETFIRATLCKGINREITTTAHYDPLYMYKTLNATMSKDSVSPFAQLSLKSPKTRSRHASRSSSTSSVGSQRVLQMHNSYANYANVSENAIVDDDETDSTPLVSPNLMATSYNDSQGKLLPSLSTISLLSLSRENNLDMSPGDMKRKSMSRQASFSGSSRVPVPFQVQRHHYYNNSIAHSRRASQQQQQQQQPIPIITNGTPDTPTFGPTSLANSPSGFILSQQQLPNSYQQQRHAFPGMSRHNSHNGMVMGNMSPFLEPIQDEQVPMTPLMLSEVDE